MKKSELDATIEALRKENRELNEFRLVVAHTLMRPDWCSLKSLARYVKEDIEYLRKENLKLNAQIAMYEGEDGRR